MYVYMSVYVHDCVYIRRVCMYAHVCICMYVYVCISVYYNGSCLEYLVYFDIIYSGIYIYYCFVFMPLYIQ